MQNGGIHIRLTLKGQTVRRLSVCIAAKTDETTRHLPLQLVRTCEECRMRTTVSSRDTEPCRITEDDIGTPFAGRLEHCQRQKVSSAHKERACRMDGLGQSGEVLYGTVDIGILHEHATKVLARRLVVEILQRITDDQVDTEAFGASSEDSDGLGRDPTVREEGALLSV